MKYLLLLFAAMLPSIAYADPFTVSPNVAVIAPPPVVFGSFLADNGLPPIVAFAERQGVTLAAPLATDASYVIPAGTVVDSYFVAANQTGANVVTSDYWISFNQPVLGVVFLDQVSGMPSVNFGLTDFLGNPSTSYQEANCFQCGFEGLPGTPNNTDDWAYQQTFTVSFHATYSDPGDFARVIIAHAPSPVPGPIVGGGIPGLLALGAWLLYRKRFVFRWGLICRLGL